MPINLLKQSMRKSNWIKLPSHEIRKRVFQALEMNIDFRHSDIMGVPASHLDSNVFYDDFPFLEQAPFLSALVKNPNHIGCHTLGDSEDFFKGTQSIERETIELLGVDLFAAPENSIDGYIASGGTEANIQACWIYRNMFLQKGLNNDEIVLICSEDTHYSLPKASNLLAIDLLRLPVDSTTRQIDLTEAGKLLSTLQGKKAAIVVLNMGTTMFGSVDDTIILDLVEKQGLDYMAHVDGAYGGFIYAVSNSENPLSFKDQRISSITIDAHKMLQAPYGTGIFLARKGLMEYAITPEAGYVNGLDLTLSGSRSGANAIAVWMILMTYGYYGWKEMIETLNRRTDYLCEQLDKKKVRYFREENLNIVTLYSKDIDPEVCISFGLVPETHDGANAFWKIVIMQHVDLDLIQRFIDKI